MPRSTFAAFACAALMLGLAGCGGDNSSSTNTTRSDAAVTVRAEDSLKFDASTYTAKSTNGEVLIQEVDDGSQTHTLRIDGVSSSAFRLQVDGKGNADSKSIALKPGKYTIYCDIPGHRAAGMEATLIVS